MSKYYTPTIEEFHVGFEYEVFKPSEDNPERKWKKITFYYGEVDRTYNQTTMIINYPGLSKQPLVRVKHLDREDIESLGGVKIKDVHNGKHPSYDCFSFERPKYEWFVVMFNYTDNWCTIHMENHTEDIRFYGAIKNKSELKRILKQLGI